MPTNYTLNIGSAFKTELLLTLVYLHILLKLLQLKTQMRDAGLGRHIQTKKTKNDRKKLNYTHVFILCSGFLTFNELFSMKYFYGNLLTCNKFWQNMD